MKRVLKVDKGIPNKMIESSKSRTKSASQSKAIDVWNTKINRCLPRAVIYTYRNAFLALDVVQTVAIGGAQASVKTRTGNNNPAIVSLVTSTIVVTPSDDCHLRKLNSLQVSFQSPKAACALEKAYPLASSSWRLVETTDDGTDIGIYHVNVPNSPFSIVAIVWKAGLQVNRIFVIVSIPMITSTLLNRSLEPIYDDLDRFHGLHGYTIALTLRQLDGTILWEYEFYDVDFTPTKNGATCQLLDSTSAHRDKSRLIQGKLALAVVTDAFTSFSTRCMILDVAVWDHAKVGRVGTCQCVALRTLPPTFSHIDMDIRVDKCYQMMLEVNDVACTIELYVSKKRAIVAAIEIILHRLFLETTYGLQFNN
ncbi:hypothetical protein THRCLA_00700 [Thraustotheca clavata]|uniref:Uncharacterized protein n=1 Tax=Thraustotheca clavata TaxID=74557 RepID=A0A1W0AAH8_9STRA|nr:hypothetical protein THRCLA_00700 [Thraustotheca clavata]